MRSRFSICSCNLAFVGAYSDVRQFVSDRSDWRPDAEQDALIASRSSASCRANEELPRLSRDQKRRPFRRKSSEALQGPHEKSDFQISANARRTFLATTLLIAPSIAFADTPAPTFIDTINDQGVDLTSGLPWFQIEEGGIGSGPGRVAMRRIWAEGAKWVDNWTGGVFDVTTGSTTKTYVQIAGTSDVFTKTGSAYTADKANGATLSVLPNSDLLYTAADGTKIEFNNTSSGDTASYCPGANAPTCHVPITITQPNGMKFSLTWDLAVQCVQKLGPDCTNEWDYYRLHSVTSSAGYSLSVTYWTNSPGTAQTPGYAWYRRTSVVFNNSANPPSPAPTITYAYPGPLDVTDPAGRMWVFTSDANGNLTGIQRPGSSANNISYSYGADGTVSSSTKDGVTNSYSRSVVGTTATETLTNPLSQQRIVTSDTSLGRPTSDKDELGRTTSYIYDTNSRLTQITAPENNYLQYAYDARGNVTSRTLVAKPGSGLTNLVSSASFDSTCSNVVKCNKPNSTTDAKGNQTSFTYDPNHGGVLTVTRAAPKTGAVQPQTRYSYSQIASASGDLVYMRTGVSACQTTSSCTGASDEAKSSTTYNSNLVATSVTVGDGTGALAATTSYTYDSHGNVATAVGPLGTAETTQFRYDIADQLVGVTGPNPGGASLPDRAIRVTYRPDGQVSKRELGTVVDQSDSAWANFAPAQTVDIGFDANSRPITSQLSANGTPFALTQTSYDALGRVNCSAIRMNTGAYASLPSSACTLGIQGSDGPDRISQSVYDAAGEVTQVLMAVGTSDAATERTLTYTNNGQVHTATDGSNNQTTYVYDGFDRLFQIQYASPSKGAGTSNSADYEQFSYDANGNVTAFRNRAGQSISYSYDALDREIAKGGAAAGVNYTYDNLGRMLTATFATGGQAITNSYDALGRLTSSSTNMDGVNRVLNSAYDLAGNRISLTGDSGYSAAFGYFTTGQLETVKDNAGATIATISLDNLGRRSAIGLGSNNSSWAGYGYDGASRLTSIARRFAVAGSDANLTFTYNSASQMTGQTRDNDAYAWTGAVNVNRLYTVNGLNQYTVAGAANFTYDANGNLISDGTNSYAYDAENRLTSATIAGVTTTLSYDPLGRLWQVVKGSSNTRFIYDFDHLLMEFDGSGNLLRSYVNGTGADEPLVWYEGSGTSNRRFLSADERGSIVAVMDNGGNRIALNGYDEYGIPGSGNQGRFQYTGQEWLTEVGMYYYKARFYSPTLGRFLQSDPVGPVDSPNIYQYALNDPANNSDASGMDCTGDCSPIFVIATLLTSSIAPLPLGGTVSGVNRTDGWARTPPPASPPPTPSAQCAKGLKNAKKDMASVNRAKAAWKAIQQAAAAAGIDPALLAAVGVRESGFGAPGTQNEQDGAGVGVGVFQLTVSKGSKVTYAQAANVATAAPIAAHHLAGDMRALANHFSSFTPEQLLQATAAAYNMGLGNPPGSFSNFSGNPNTIDVGTAHGNYGSNVVDIMACFKGM